MQQSILIFFVVFARLSFILKYCVNTALYNSPIVCTKSASIVTNNVSLCRLQTREQLCRHGPHSAQCRHSCPSTAELLGGRSVVQRKPPSTAARRSNKSTPMPIFSPGSSNLPTWVSDIFVTIIVLMVGVQISGRTDRRKWTHRRKFKPLSGKTTATKFNYTGWAKLSDTTLHFCL